MHTDWREFVGQQLNTLAAIVFLGVIAVAAMVTGQGDTVTIPCVTGIAGIAGTIQRAGSRSSDTPVAAPATAHETP